MLVSEQVAPLQVPPALIENTVAAVTLRSTLAKMSPVCAVCVMVRPIAIVAVAGLRARWSNLPARW
jgi:hypothetical protein